MFVHLKGCIGCEARNANRSNCPNSIRCSAFLEPEKSSFKKNQVLRKIKF